MLYNNLGYLKTLKHSILTLRKQKRDNLVYSVSYDVTIGTSEKGTSVDEFECPAYNHLLIMFGGLQGLEAALENDENLNVEDPSLLFDHYLNTLPDQGSRTIRTEEALLISLSALRSKLNPLNKPVVNCDIDFDS